MPTVREAGQLFGIVMALLFVPFYVVALVVSDSHSFIVQLFTYCPYSAPVTAMLRNGSGSMSASGREPPRSACVR
jgi:ABC-2 type transport system permease protein